MYDPHKNYRHVRGCDNQMSYQEPKSGTTSSTTTTTSSESDSIILACFILFTAFIICIGAGVYSIAEPPLPQNPKPTQWPDQFHSIIVMNNSGVIEIVDLWYDSTDGYNYNIIQRQLESALYVLEIDYGVSYYYKLYLYWFIHN